MSSISEIQEETTSVTVEHNDYADEADDEDDDNGSFRHQHKKVSGEAERRAKKLQIFASTMADILGRGGTGGNTRQGPVLSKRKAKELREMATERTDGNKKDVQQASKRTLLNKDLVQPTHLTANYEKSLRKIATRGVVALFNAIKTHQRSADTDSNRKGKKRKKGKDLTKESFLKMLKTSQKDEKKKSRALNLTGSSTTPASAAVNQTEEPTGDEAGTAEKKKKKSKGTGGWDVLQEDMLLGSTMRDWDKADEENSGKKLKKSADVEDPEEASLWDDGSSSSSDDGGDLDDAAE